MKKIAAENNYRLLKEAEEVNPAQQQYNPNYFGIEAKQIADTISALGFSPKPRTHWDGIEGEVITTYEANNGGMALRSGWIEITIKQTQRRPGPPWNHDFLE